MSIEVPQRAGTAPLSRLDALPPLERRLVACARLWRAGEAGRARIRADLASRRGPAEAGLVLDRLDAVLGLILDHGRRPLRLNPAGAEGVLGDECVLARFVALATEGAREDAVLIAALLVRADLALGLARAAEALGLLLLRAAGPAPRPPS